MKSRPTQLVKKGGEGVVEPPVHRAKAARSSIESRMRGSTTQGIIKPLHQPNLLGPRISHIGSGAISNMYMLSGLGTGQTRQAQLFKSKDIKSRARQTGRPLGYGTIYKFF